MIGAYLAGLATLPALVIAWALRPGFRSYRPAIAARGWVVSAHWPTSHWHNHVARVVAGRVVDLHPVSRALYGYLLGGPTIRFTGPRTIEASWRGFVVQAGAA